MATIQGTNGNDILNGTANDPANGTGTFGDDSIYGQGGNDRIDGRGGVDLILAGFGDDTVLVTTFGPVVRTEDSYYDGGDDVDTLDLSALSLDLTVSLARIAVISAGTNITVRGLNFETLRLGSGVDIVSGVGFFGVPTVRQIFLGDGNDQYSGGGGSGSMVDEPVFVDVHGGGGADRISASGVSLFGDDGDDILSPATLVAKTINLGAVTGPNAKYRASQATREAGLDDRLTVVDGGAGIDTFLALDGGTVDLAAGRIKDSAGTATANIVSVEQLVDIYGGTTFIGNDANNVFVSFAETTQFSTSAVQFYGGGGDDTLDVGSAAGLANGGTGNDAIHTARPSGSLLLTVDGGSGNDSVNFAFSFNEATVQARSGATDISYQPSRITISVYRVSGVETYVFADRTINLDDGKPLVDDLYYLNRYRDVAASGMDADDHYAQFGMREGRDPNAYFSTGAYLSVNGDVRAASLDPLDHYDRFGWKEGRDPSAAFDTRLYLLNNPDVNAAGIDPLAHFIRYGREEGRAAYAAIGPLIDPDGFDSGYYLLANADVAAAAQGARDPRAFAAQHYATYGWKEGRDPNAWFDTDGYLAAYKDVATAGVDPLDHYAAYGWKEGRDPSASFDTTAYLASYADVAAAGANPLVHYLTFGAYERRSTFSDGIFDV